MELVDKIGMRALNLIAQDLGRREWAESDGLFFKLQGPTPLMLEETARIVREVAQKNEGTNFEYAATEEEALGLWEVRMGFHVHRMWRERTCRMLRSKVLMVVYKFILRSIQGIGCCHTYHVTTSEGYLYTALIFRDHGWKKHCFTEPGSRKTR